MSESVSALRIISIVLPIFTIVVVGWGYGRKHSTDMADLNQLNMEIFLPALIFSTLSDKSFDLTNIMSLVYGSFLMVVGSGLLGWLVSWLLGISPKTFVPSMMFNNGVNMGLPLTVLAFGQSASVPAVAMYLVSNLLHFSFGHWFLGHHTRWWSLWRMPVVAASIAALALNLSAHELSPLLKPAFKLLGDVSIPLMLFALGVRIAKSQVTAIRIGIVGALARPAIGVALGWLLAELLRLDGQWRSLLILYGALPPAVLNYIFADRYRQGPDEVAAIVIFGHLAAVFIIPIVLTFVL